MRKKYFAASLSILDQLYKDHLFKFDNPSEVPILEKDTIYRTIQAHM